MKNVHDVGVCDLPTCKIGLFSIACTVTSAIVEGVSVC